jgi:hypothetical protein
MRTRVLSIVAMLCMAAPAWAQDVATETPPEEKQAEGVAAPNPEEQKALEADMEAAKKKLQEAPAQAGTGGFEEIKAAPVDAGATQDANVTIGTKEESKLQAKLSGTEGLDSDRPWGGLVVLDHSVGAGTFTSDSTLRSSFAYAAQSWDIRPHYVFDVQGIKLKAAARILFEYEYTTPDTNPARRFKPLDTTFSVGAPEIYKEPWSEVSFNASARVFVPTSWESINIKKQWGGTGFTLGAQRFFGPLHVSYAFMMNKYFNSEKAQMTYSSVCRGTDPCKPPPTGTSDPATFPGGPLNSSFAVMNSFGVDYSITETLSVSYSLLIRNFFSYSDKSVNVVDKNTSPFADAGRGRVDQLWPSLSVDYVVDEWVKKVVDLPVSLSVSGGITALHPAQTADNKGIIWPVFYQAFGQSRATNNYGSVFFDIAGSF